MSKWIQGVKSGAWWALLLVVSSAWVEGIRNNLWWILMTMLGAAVLTGAGFALLELQRQDHDD